MAEQENAKGRSKGGLLGKILGSWYGQNYVVGVMEDGARAEQAASALRDAGFPARDVTLADGEEVNRRMEREDLADLLAEVGTEEGAFCRSYNEQARAGQLLSVYTRSDEQVERARRILAEHGARSMRHFGDWTMREMT